MEVADDFFAGTKYTDKVLGQIKTGDLHGVFSRNICWAEWPI